MRIKQNKILNNCFFEHSSRIPRLGLIILLASVFLGRMSAPPVQAAADSTVYFNPASGQQDINSDFTLDAMIDPGVNEVTAVEMHVTFDQTKFRLDDISTTGGAFSTTLEAASINNTDGTASIIVGVPATSPVVPVIDVGKIATFSFHTLAAVTNSSIAIPTSTVASALNESGDVVKTRTPAAITVVDSSDTTAPTVTQVTAVPSPTNDTTPNYTFNTTEAGAITYGGDCSSATTSATSGNNTITFNTLAAGTHSNCTITVTDAANNPSSPLSVNSFTIDTTAPRIQNISSDKSDGTYKVGEVIDIDVTFSEAVTSTGNVTVTLETGSTDRTCTFSVSNSTTGTCNYTVQSGDISSDLTVNTVSGTIADQAGNSMSNFTPITNLADNKALVIDTSAPVRSGGSPSTALASGTTSTTLMVTTNENATCKYSTTSGVAYASMTNTFGTTGGTSHSETINGLTDGTLYHYYVRCQDVATNVNSSDYAINFSVTNPGDTTPPTVTEVTPVTTPTTETTPNYTFNSDEAGTITYGGDCSSDTTAAVSGDNTITFDSLAAGTYSNCTITVTDASDNPSTALHVTAFTVDNVAPVLSNGSPSGSLANTTTDATLSVTTNEAATCKYGTITGTSYDSLPNDLTTSNGTTHTASLTGLAEGNSYIYYVRCQDSLSNTNTDDYTISFSVASSDATPPTQPSNLTSDKSTNKVTLKWQPSTDVHLVGYRIYRDGEAISTVTGTKFTNRSLKQSNTYHYQVAAYDSYGNESVVATITVKTDAEKSINKNASGRKIGNYPKEVPYGEILTQYGKKFTKNSSVALFFSRPSGGYYPPKIVKTDSKGNFQITYKALKSKGTYSWYAVNLATGWKSHTMKYSIK